jgi:hypothetical protein
MKATLTHTRMEYTNSILPEKVMVLYEKGRSREFLKNIKTKGKEDIS